MKAPSRLHAYLVQLHLLVLSHWFIMVHYYGMNLVSRSNRHDLPQKHTSVPAPRNVSDDAHGCLVSSVVLVAALRCLRFAVAFSLTFSATVFVSHLRPCLHFVGGFSRNL